MIIDKKKAVSITGYNRRQQSIAGIEPSAIDNLNIYDQIVRLHAKRGFNTFLCGLYDGFDLVAAQAVLKARVDYPEIKLVAVIPFESQEVGYDPDDRALYEKILHNVNHYVFTSYTYHPGAFARHCHFLSNHCSSVLCFHSGVSCNTTRIVSRAIQRGVEVINLYSD